MDGRHQDNINFHDLEYVPSCTSRPNYTAKHHETDDRQYN